MTKIVVISNSLSSLYVFRSELINELSNNLNNEVYLLSNNELISKDLKIKIKSKHNIHFKKIYLNRTSTNIFKEIISILNIFYLLLLIRPKYLLSFTIKPVIYCGLLNFFFNYKQLSTITGLGRVFYPIWRTTKLKNTVIFLYKLSQIKTFKMFFQNSDDLKYFSELKINKQKNFVLVNGSGVDLDIFKYNNNGFKNNSILMISRLLNQKGVLLFLKAAEIIKPKYNNLNFILIGKKEEGKDALKFEEIKKYIDNKIITYIPRTYEIQKYLTNSKIFVLPSIYREGMPRTMIEALSVGRPVVVSDIPGPKDFIVNKKHGMIVKGEDQFDLINAIEHIINLNKTSYDQISYNCRNLAKENFDVNLVIKKYLNFMN